VIATSNFNTLPWGPAFFGGPNTLQWLDVLSGSLPNGWSDDVAFWLDQLSRNTEAAGVLPHVAADGSTTWYGVATTDRASRSLLEDLNGFVGATYSEFSGRPHLPDATDPQGVVLVAAFAAPLYRIHATSVSDIRTIRRAFHLYQQLIERRPSAARLSPRSVGALRSRFDRALLAGDHARAQSLYDEILASGRLSWDNRLYLRVRLHAGLGQWPLIAMDTQLLREAGNFPLPVEVRADIIEALYRTFAEPHEAAVDATKALTAFSSAGAGCMVPLFSTRQGISRPRVIKAFLLHALLKPPPQPDEIASLCDLLPMGSPQDAAFTSALRELAATIVGPPPLTGTPNVSEPDADAAFEDFDYDRAIDLYAAQPSTPKAVRRMLHCAKMIRSEPAVRTALGAYDALTPPPQDQTPALRATLEELRALLESFSAAPSSSSDTSAAAAPVPDDWLSWCRSVAQGMPKAVASRVLDERHAAWSCEPYRSPTDAQQLADQLGNAAFASADVVHRAFPYLYETFVGDHDTANPAWKPIYANLLTALAMSEGRSAEDLELARTLASVMLDAGLDTSEYDAMIRDLRDILDKEAALSTLDWALDLAEVLLLNRATLPDARLGIVVAVLDIARARAHRLAARHIKALRMLCDDLGIDVPDYLTAPEAPDGSDEIKSELDGRTIAIYTLAESAGQRAVRLLRDMAPTATVTLNNDLVCTDRLASLARQAELFVFAWRSSKHAAYYCVKNHRPEKLPLLLPRGKGTASIIQALLEA